MTPAIEWFRDPAFWRDNAGMLFSSERWEKTPAEVDEILTRVGDRPRPDILDLCCGPGRHSLELARRGFRVTGVDLTREYLRDAEQRARDEGLAIEFVQDDMRTFRRPGAFDLALNLFTSFGYFDEVEDDRRVIENLHDSLRDGGALIIECMGKEILARCFRERDWQRLEDGSLLIEEREILDDWRGIHCTWTRIGDTGRLEHTFTHRLYSGSELATLLREVGFTDVSLFGSLGGTPYGPDAKRLVAVARK